MEPSERNLKEALQCPCVADLVNGPCGKQFSEAFGCFFKSEKPDRGSDCVPPFEKMKWCMHKNSGEFTTVSLSGAYKTAGKHIEGQKPAEKKPSRFTATEVLPPPVSVNDVRFPQWYLRAAKAQAQQVREEKLAKEKQAQEEKLAKEVQTQEEKLAREKQAQEEKLAVDTQAQEKSTSQQDKDTKAT